MNETNESQSMKDQLRFFLISYLAKNHSKEGLPARAASTMVSAFAEQGLSRREAQATVKEVLSLPFVTRREDSFRLTEGAYNTVEQVRYGRTHKRDRKLSATEFVNRDGSIAWDVASSLLTLSSFGYVTLDTQTESLMKEAIRKNVDS